MQLPRNIPPEQNWLDRIQPPWKAGAGWPRGREYTPDTESNTPVISQAQGGPSAMPADFISTWQGLRQGAETPQPGSQDQPQSVRIPYDSTPGATGGQTESVQLVDAISRLLSGRSGMSPESTREPGSSVPGQSGQPQFDPAVRSNQQAAPQGQPTGQQPQAFDNSGHRAMIQQAVNQTKPQNPYQPQPDPMVYLENYGRVRDRITKKLNESASIYDVANAMSAGASGGDFGATLNALRAAKIKEQMAAYEAERDYAKTALDTYNKSSRLAIGAKDPARVAEYKYFKSLPEDEQEEYLETMWAQQNIDLRDRVIQAPRGGGPGRTFKKGVPPEAEPGFREKVKGAEKTGEETAKRTFNMTGIGEIMDRAEAVLGGQQPPTGSYMGWVVDQAGRIVGYSPPGATEATELEAIGGALVAKMPRMEGPQSDYDRQNYIQMAGQIGDRTVPADQRRRALQVVRGLWAKYENAQQAPDAKPGGVMTLDEYLKSKGQ